jgi:hypothetical protein
LTATDEQVHIWYYDRQGGIQSYGLNMLKNLPHFFVLLLALQRLDLKGWGFAPDLSFDTANDSSAKLDVTLYNSAGDIEAPVQPSAAYVKFTPDQVLREYWGLVGRATTVFECDLASYPPKGQVVKLSWPEVSRTPEPDILKVLGKITDVEVKGHVPELLASQMLPEMNTQIIRERLGSQSRSREPRVPRVPRRLVITVSRKLTPVWGLTADGFYDVWTQTLRCKLDRSMPGVHD